MPGASVRMLLRCSEPSPATVAWHASTALAVDVCETHLGGEPVGFIIGLEYGHPIDPMGDTGLFGNLQLIGGMFNPDLVPMPIGGHFVTGPKQAAMATTDFLKPKHVIPVHYGTNPLLAGTPAQCQEALGKSATQVHALNPGDKIEFRPARGGRRLIRRPPRRAAR